MRRWVVTGPMGSGKSSLSRCLADRGAAVLDGDRLGHEILARPEIMAAVAARFGGAMVVDGHVDRARLGALVFGDAAALADLDRITHGPLAELFAARLADLARGGDRILAVLEAAVYFLLPNPPVVDLVIAVTAPEAVRRARLMARDGLTDAAAANRLAAQASWATFWQRADVVVVNDGSRGDLTAIADDLMSRYL